MLKSYAIIVILVVAFLSGCQKSYYTYDNTQTVANTNGDTNKNYPIHVQMVYRGLKKNHKDGSLALSFEVLMENLGDKEVVIHPKSYYLQDEVALRINPVVKDVHEKLILSPNTSTKFPMYYPLPHQYDMAKANTFHLTWNYDAEDENYQLTTKFDKKRLKSERNYYGYPYSARFFRGGQKYQQMGYGHSPLWRYQNLENNNRKRKKH